MGGSVGQASNFSSGHHLTVRGFEPALGSVLTVQRLEPASDSVCVSLSAPSWLVHCQSLSQKKANIKKQQQQQQQQQKGGNGQPNVHRPLPG